MQRWSRPKPVVVELVELLLCKLSECPRTCPKRHEGIGRSRASHGRPCNRTRPRARQITGAEGEGAFFASFTRVVVELNLEVETRAALARHSLNLARGRRLSVGHFGLFRVPTAQFAIRASPIGVDLARWGAFCAALGDGLSTIDTLVYLAHKKPPTG